MWQAILAMLFSEYTSSDLRCWLERYRSNRSGKGGVSCNFGGKLLLRLPLPILLNYFHDYSGRAVLLGSVIDACKFFLSNSPANRLVLEVNRKEQMIISLHRYHDLILKSSIMRQSVRFHHLTLALFWTLIYRKRNWKERWFSYLQTSRLVMVALLNNIWLCYLWFL